MGRGDNRRTLKMRQRFAQAKKRQRRAALLASVGSPSVVVAKSKPVKKASTRTTIKRPRASSGEVSG